MSKAFTKEDAPEVEDEPEESLPALPGGKNYMTPICAEKMRAEYLQLIKVDRPKVVEAVSWAASNGDRSENADYIYGKRRLREIDRRARFLLRRLEIAVIVDPGSQKSDQVLFGATVTVETSEQRARVYQIVGIDETHPQTGKISWTSPVGRALLNAKVGDVVNFKTPKGDEELEVLKIEYLPTT